MGRARVSRSLCIVLLALLATGCSTGFERRYAEAERLRADAAAMDAEWLNTEDLLVQARRAADAGDTDEALALVAEARLQAEAAILQAESLPFLRV